MNEHRYILQPYTGRNSRYTCPACGKAHEFSRYIDTETGEVLAENVGRCNRIDQCGYHYTPKQYFADTGTKPTGTNIFYKAKPEPPKPVSYISDEVFNQSLKGYEANNLIKYLYSIFDAETVANLINLYRIGTSSRYGGGTTVFWQIDTHDKVRAGKLIKYAENGHRVHGKNNWVHSVLSLDNFNLRQCLFGEHILKHAPSATVCIVESEKTAIIASAFLPDMVWLATGGAENLNKEKIKILKDRKVILFPDASKDGRIFRKWKQEANEFGFNISDLLEKEATPEQKAAGVDIADFLIRQDWRLHRETTIKQRYETLNTPEPATTKIADPETNWDKDIQQLEAYFANTVLPVTSVKLNPWTKIIDAHQFIDSHLATLKKHNGNRHFKPHLERLNEFMELLNN